MTIGERIAQKRKELGLSQEALGEKLCVSRQAIYKWEADATLPEIEKLVALAKLFSVPVGWLLGVEEEAETETPGDGGELNETQVKLVEEIVSRYLAAQPKPKKARRWPKVAAAILIVVVGIHLFNRLDGLDNQYNNLQSAMGNLNWSVNDQIDGIAGRVEAILKSQNDLTADYGTEMIRADLAENTATFALRAVPKTFVDGLEAVFLVNCGAGPVEFPAVLSDGGVFSAGTEVELTDDISLSVVFIDPDGTRRTQLLDTYEGLFSGSLPWVSVDGMHLYWREVKGGAVQLGGEDYASVRIEQGKSLGGQEITVEQVRVGVFVNEMLIAWAEECDQPASYRGDWGDDLFFRLPTMSIELSTTDRLEIAALVTDNFGRQFMACDIPFAVEHDEEGNAELGYADDTWTDSDPASWALTNYETAYHTTTPIKKAEQ